MIDSTNEKPPDTQKGRGKPPTSNRNPPMVGPNIVPIPKQDSARAVALPWFTSFTCCPARVKAAGVREDSPGGQYMMVTRLIHNFVNLYLSQSRCELLLKDQRIDCH